MDRTHIRTRLVPLVLLALLLLAAAFWEQRSLERNLETLAGVQAGELADRIQQAVLQARNSEALLSESLTDQLFAAAWLAAQAESAAWTDLGTLLGRGGVALLARFDSSVKVQEATTDDSMLLEEIAKALAAKHSPSQLRERKLGLVGPPEGQVFAVAVITDHGGFACAAIRAEEWLGLRRLSGMGQSLRQACAQDHIRWALVQQDEQILAAAGDLPDPVPSFLSSTRTDGTDVIRSPDGFHCRVSLDPQQNLVLRVLLSDAAFSSLRQRGFAGLWLRAAALLALAMALLGWQVTRGRNRELELERDRVTREVRALEERRALDERTRSMAETAAGVAHALRNPLNTISMSSQRLRREFEPREDGEEFDHLLQAMQAEAARMGGIVGDFLSVARPHPARPEAIDLRLLLEDLLRLHREAIEKTGILCELDSPEELPIMADAGQLREALGNLLENALQTLSAKGQGGHLRILARSADGRVEILVDDDGPGIPAEERGRVFDLYYTSRPEGTGLGLPLARRVALDHGGDLVAEASPLGGARLRMTLDGRSI